MNNDPSKLDAADTDVVNPPDFVPDVVDAAGRQSSVALPIK